jgi:Fic family protein
MLNKISQIEEIRSRILHSNILPEREIEMRYRATVEATHSSTSIEGNPLNIKQVEKVLSNLSDNPITRHRYAEIEVRNYKKTLDFIEKRKTTKKAIELTDILFTHKILMEGLLPEEKIGKLRFNPIYIADQDDNAVYSGPTVNILKKEIAELLDWLDKVAKDIHPVIASGILHFHFVSIHPFADGNGRTTRLLTMLYLGLRDYDFRSSLVLDSYYSIDKKEYYDALNLSDHYAGRKASNLNPWLGYFIDGFLSASKILLTEVLLLSNAIKDLKEVKRISKDEADLLSYAKQFGSISLAEAMDILPDVSRRTLQRRLKALVDDGYLKLSGDTNNATYTIVLSQEEHKPEARSEHI